MQLIPLHQSVDQDLQVDLIYFLGKTFFMSISVLLGLIMVSHLGQGYDSTSTNDKTTARSRSEACQALIAHLEQYRAKGFRIKSVISDLITSKTLSNHIALKSNQSAWSLIFWDVDLTLPMQSQLYDITVPQECHLMKTTRKS